VEPQVESSADEGTIAGSNQSLCKIASGASLSALSPCETATPSTPALTPGISFIADDLDTNFQSAYSTSPQDTYISFDGRQITILMIPLNSLIKAAIRQNRSLLSS
jgi:hypothetical protein